MLFLKDVDKMERWKIILYSLFISIVFSAYIWVCFTAYDKAIDDFVKIDMRKAIGLHELK